MIFITFSYIVTNLDPHVYDPHEKEISHIKVLTNAS